jgi:hypothetical protein
MLAGLGAYGEAILFILNLNSFRLDFAILVEDFVIFTSPDPKA